MCLTTRRPMFAFTTWQHRTGLWNLIQALTQPIESHVVMSNKLWTILGSSHIHDQTLQSVHSWKTSHNFIYNLSAIVSDAIVEISYTVFWIYRPNMVTTIPYSHTPPLANVHVYTRIYMYMCKCISDTDVSFCKLMCWWSSCLINVI